MGKHASFSPVILKQEERKSADELLERRRNGEMSAGIRALSAAPPSIIELLKVMFWLFFPSRLSTA